MASVYRYELSAFPYGAVNYSRLAAEAVVDGLPIPVNVTSDDETDDVLVVFEEALTDEQKAGLDVVVTNHVDDAHHLPSLKTQKFAEIDRKTTRLIEAGFTYQGRRFSLGGTAQIKLIGIDLMRNDPLVVYPVKYNTLDDADSISLQDATSVHDFVLMAFGTYRAFLDSGTALKDQVRAATTVEAVNIIVDPR